MKMSALAAGTAMVGLSLSVVACGGSSKHTAAKTIPSGPASSASMPASSPGGDQPFGSACSAVPASGPGSFNGMAADPVATAASHNPVLSTLVSAVQKAGLVDTLNSAQGITVFAPTNAAFDKIPKATLDQVMGNKQELTSILTYHVVSGRHAPADLAAGNFKTLEGGMVSTAGSNDSYTVNNSAHVVCGNVQTANATVYIIDSVLMPPKA